MGEQKDKKEKTLPAGMTGLLNINIQISTEGVGVNVDQIGVSDVEAIGYLEHVKATIMSAVLDKTQSTRSQQKQTLDGGVVLDKTQSTRSQQKQTLDGGVVPQPTKGDEKKTIN
jgi:hypothetical protein